MRAAPDVTCVILGGGGHARALVDIMEAAALGLSCAILDADRSHWGSDVRGVPILGGDQLLPDLVRAGARYFVVGLGSTGDNRPRRRLFELGCSHGLQPLTLVHPAAIRSRWATIGPGSQLFQGSIVNAGATLGANVIVNSGAIVEHDCYLADHVHAATGCRLASTVRVGTGAHIGVGATVRQCATIGDGAIVGAGAVVIGDVPPGTVVVGVPARVLRKVDELGAGRPESDAGPDPLVGQRKDRDEGR